ncbi:MAG: dihydrofolate reductase [Pseudomonadota bacterium]|nr:dihydrofolate reductase [Pseudomonadota bacterium]
MTVSSSANIPKLSLHTLLTLDGYVADPTRIEAANLNIEPLSQYMLDRSDALVLGRPTYLSLVDNGVWPYPNHLTYVLSRHKDWSLEQPQLHGSTESLSTLLPQMTEHDIQNVWLMGGRRLVMAALAEHQLDELIIHLLPITQSSGKPFFDQHHLSHFELIHVERLEQGIVRMQYHVSYD